MKHVILLFALAGVTVQAQQPAASTTFESVRAHRQGTAIWWTGNAGWLIKSGDLLIAVDLDLSLPQKLQPPPLAAEALAGELDVVFVSHHHGDHCNGATLRALARGTRTTFVLP